MERKKKLRLIQLSLLILGILIILFTYLGNNRSFNEQIISKEKQEKVKKQLQDKSNDINIFYNIEYSGLDLSGNRYILKSKEAFSNKSDDEIVNMKTVEATFYFKNDTKLNVWSEKGQYNNKTLDMIFEKNVKAIYGKSQLFAEKAEYSNSKNYLIISKNVKVKDVRGSVFADELIFDIKKQTLNIASFNDGKVNTNLNLK